MSELETLLLSGRIDDAADWHARLQSDDAGAEVWAEFTAWLEADPLNRLAYDRIEDAESMLAALPAETLSGPESFKLNLIQFARPAPRRRSIAPWVAGVLAAAASLLLVFAPHMRKTGPEEFRTQFGETRTIALAGGTTIILNSHTGLRVSGDRHVALLYGEAAFSVVRQPDHPFSVTVGDQTVRDIGTIFDIVRDGRATKVSVTEGEVAIAPSGEASSMRQIDLGAGAQLTHVDGARQSLLAQIDPDAVLAWRKGLLVYRDAPLAVVVGDLNRYFPAHVELTGADIARQRFSGVLRIESEDNMIRHITEFLPIAADRRPDGKIALHMTASGR